MMKVYHPLQDATKTSQRALLTFSRILSDTEILVVITSAARLSPKRPVLSVTL
jgi:hypothetical protein